MKTNEEYVWEFYQNVDPANQSKNSRENWLRTTLEEVRREERERILEYVSGEVELCDTYYDMDVEMVPLEVIRKALIPTKTDKTKEV